MKWWTEHETRFRQDDGQRLVFAKLRDHWRIMVYNAPNDGPHGVGPLYATKAELLADLTRYALEYGFR